MQLDAKDVIILVQFLVIIVAMVANYRSISPEFARMVLAFAKERAAQTPSKIDDEAVKQAEQFVDKMYPSKEPTPAAAG